MNKLIKSEKVLKIGLCLFAILILSSFNSIASVENIIDPTKLSKTGSNMTVTIGGNKLVCTSVTIVSIPYKYNHSFLTGSIMGFDVLNQKDSLNKVMSICVLADFFNPDSLFDPLFGGMDIDININAPDNGEAISAKLRNCIVTESHFDLTKFSFHFIATRGVGKQGKSIFLYWDGLDNKTDSKHGSIYLEPAL